MALSPGPAPYHIAIYIAGQKVKFYVLNTFDVLQMDARLQGEPSVMRLCLVDHSTFPTVSNKTFMKADGVHFNWNSKGTALLCTTSTEVDKTNQSYYGEQQLCVANR